MARSSAATVGEYLAELPEDRREVVRATRMLVLGALPAGYHETMAWGMISYEIPLADYPNTYNGQPLCYAALAAQKRHVSLYLMSLAQDGDEERRLRDAFSAAGLRLDLGKSCLRFRTMADLVPEAVAAVIAATPPDAFIARYEASRRPAGH